MKIVLCSINSKFIHSSLAVWYLKASMIDLENVNCEVIESTINENVIDIYERIAAGNADLVCFSTYIWNKQMVLELAHRLKENFNVKILLGGPEVSYNAKDIMMEHPFVDYVISGEGEIAIRELASGVELDKIDGLFYKKCGEVYEKEPCVLKCDPPNPYTDEYLGRLNGRIAYIETSRGCPFNCAFCLSGRCGGVRFFDVERSKQNIIKLANSGTQTVKFIDRTFNADKKRAKELFRFIIDSYGNEIPKNVCFHFEIEGELLDEETIEVLKDAPNGLIQFEIGVQSFNSNTLKAINRKANLERLCENIRKVIALGNVHTHIDLIVGLPYENLDSFKHSFDLAYGLKPHMLQVGFLKLLHGTKMREESGRNCRFSHTPPYEIKENDWLSCQDLEALHDFEDTVERLYNSRRFGLTCEYLREKFDSPFEMYMGLTRYLNGVDANESLDAFTQNVFDYFSTFESISAAELRDCLAIDRLATNKMGALPDFLKNYSPFLKQRLNELEKNPSTKRARGVKRASTVLMSKPYLAYVDYTERDYVTNRFLVKFTNV